MTTLPVELFVDLPDADWSPKAVLGASGRNALHLGRRNAEPSEGVVMPSYRMVYGDNEQVDCETYVEVDREAGWTTLFRGNDAILRVRDEHVQLTEVLDEAAGSGTPPWTRVPR
jgi:hypothetical protein